MNVFDENYDTKLPEGYWLQEVFVSGEKRMQYYCHESNPALFLIYGLVDDKELGELPYLIDNSPEIVVTEREFENGNS